MPIIEGLEQTQKGLKSLVEVFSKTENMKPRIWHNRKGKNMQPHDIISAAFKKGVESVIEENQRLREANRQLTALVEDLERRIKEIELRINDRQNAILGSEDPIKGEKE